MPKSRTPIIKPRTQGGTFYTFASALEDVGLNINELKNKVSLSHYVLLNIPSFNVNSSYSSEDCNPGDYTFAEQFQNYALNMETVLRNQDNYNFANSLTVSERVFWKWMQKEGYIEFVQDEDSSGNLTGYYIDASTFADDSVIKGFGLISSGAQRTDAYGIYNETFVQIPSSYGQSKILLKPVSDKNYYITKEGKEFKATSKTGKIENIDASTELDENGNLHTGISATAVYDDDSLKAYTVKGPEEELCVEFSLSELRKYYDDETLNYDDLGIGTSEAIRPSEVNGNFYFNAVLVYYSIYDSTGKNILATNAYGLLLLDSATVQDNTAYYEHLPKKQSSLNDSGNSYSFRLNIKTSSVYNGDVIVSDNSVPGYQMATDFNDTIRNLAVAVETLRSNANLISVLSNQNTTIKEIVIKSLDKIDDIEKDIKTLKTGKVRELNTALLTTDALAANTLDASLSIGDYGSFDGNEFTYDTIIAGKSLADDASINTLTVKTILGENEEITFGKESKLTSAGLYSNNVYFNTATSASTSDRMNAADASTILGSLTPLKDGNFIINSAISSQNTSASEIGTPESEAEISNSAGVNTKLLLSAIVTKLNVLNVFDLSNADSSTELLSNILTTLDKASTIENDFDDLVEEQNDLHDTIDSSLASITDSLLAADSFISLLENAIDILDSSVALLETFAGNVDSSLSDIVLKFESIDSSLESLDSSIANLDASVQTLTNIDASLADHEERIQKLEASIGYLLDNDMYNLKERVIKPVIEEHLRYLGLLD
jgi:hypothetical protein